MGFDRDKINRGLDINKTVFMIFLVANLLLCSCGSTEKQSNLEFPKTTWGMSMEETLDSYQITIEDTSRYHETGRGSMFMIEDYELFGEKTSDTDFQFIDFADNGIFELCYVRVTYLEGSDMNHVLTQMQKVYGETISDVTVYRGFSAFGDKVLTEDHYAASENLKIWAGSSVTECIPENKSENYRKSREFFQYGLTEENWDIFSQNARMVTVIWSVDEGVNRLEFNAYQLAVYKELKNQFSEQQ